MSGIQLRTLVFFAVLTGTTAFSQKLPIIEKTSNWKIPDVEQPSLHVAPFIYYKPALILLSVHDTVSEIVYWRRNFTDQLLECWYADRIYPASRIFGFIQDSVYFRSVFYDDYHIFAPKIFGNGIGLYYTRYVQNLGEIRMVSTSPELPAYQNRMIITGDIPRRYANEFTYFVTFPWDTLTMVPVTRGSLHSFSETYLRSWPEAYKEARKYERSKAGKILGYTLLPVAVIGTAAFLVAEGNPVYFIGIGMGALVAYVTVKITLKPKMLDPEGMIGIIQKCSLPAVE